jgi:hypothetical protein
LDRNAAKLESETKLIAAKKAIFSIPTLEMYNPKIEMHTNERTKIEYNSFLADGCNISDLTYLNPPLKYSEIQNPINNKNIVIDVKINTSNKTFLSDTSSTLSGSKSKYNIGKPKY